MLKIADRIKETSLTTGTGAIILNGAFGGFQRFFAVIDDSNTTYYTIENGANWEVGQGTYTTSSNSLSRDIVFDSSSGGSKIDLQGVSTVFCTLPASKAVVRNTSDSVSLNNIYVSGEANINQISTNNIHNSGDSFLGGDTIVSGDLSVLGNFDLDINGDITADDITADFLTLIRPNSAGNFFHAYKDDGTNQTVSLYVTSAVSPLWRLGLKSSPSSQTESPSFGYVYGRDGSVGIVSNISNYLSLSDSDGVSIVNDSHGIVTISSDDGMVIDQKSTVNPALVIEGAPLSISNLQEWANSAGAAFSVVDQAGKFGILNDNPTYDLDVNGSGRLQSVYLTSGIYFPDGTFQNTALTGSSANVDAVSGIAVYASGIADQNAVDILTVSGIVGDSGVAIFASGLAVQNEIDIATVSGLLYDDTAISGYFESRAYTNENQIIAVSGWADSTMDTRDAAVSGWVGSHADAGDAAVSGWAQAYVDSQDHSATAVSGWAGSYADAGDTAVSGWAQAYVDSQDHSAAAVSGWVDGTFLTSSSVEFTYISGIAVYASGQVDQNSSDIITVSGLLYDDSSISGYIDLQDAAVSGWVQAYVDGQDHSATAVSGWAGSYADAGDAAVSGWADSTMNTRDAAVSGWVGSYADAGDAAVSGWAGSYADAGDAAVSGWADNTFNLQEVTDRGSNTTNSIFTSGNITATSGYFDTFDMTLLGNGSQPPHLEGRLFYDSENHTLSLYNDEADVTLQLGQEQFLRVRNNTGATITNGTAVLITGSHGNTAPTISGAIATSEASSQVVGLATHSIEDSSFGYVTTYGIVRNVDTSQYSDGDEIFLSATQIGSGVNSSPTIPNYKVTIGHVIRSHGSNGSVLVQIGNAKLGGGDLKSEAELNLSGVPFVTTKSNTTAGGSQTDPLFVFDSGNRQLQVGSGIQLLDGVPSNTSNVLYNNSGTLTFNGSSVGGSSTRTYNNITADFSMSDSSDVVFMDTTSGPINVYVPTAVGQGGKEIMVKLKTGSNSGVLLASGAQTIDGQSQIAVYNTYESITLISDNSNWFIS